MSRKLQNNDISLGIDIRAQQAEETIHRLTKDIENLRKQNTEGYSTAGKDSSQEVLRKY